MTCADCFSLPMYLQYLRQATEICDVYHNVKTPVSKNFQIELILSWKFHQLGFVSAY